MEKSSSYKEFMLRHGVDLDALDQETRDEVDAIYNSVYHSPGRKTKIPAQMSEIANRFLNEAVREKHISYVHSQIEISRLNSRIRKIREELETISRYFPDFVVPEDFGE